MKQSLLSLCLLGCFGFAHAAPKILRNPHTSHPPSDSKTTDSSSVVSRSQQKLKYSPYHAAFSLIGRNVHLYHFNWGSLTNNGAIAVDSTTTNPYMFQNSIDGETDKNSYQFKNLSYALELHRRLIPTIGIGAMVERVGFSRQSLDLVDVSTGNSVIDIFNDLNGSSKNLYYDMDSFSSRSYNWMGLLRGYLAPGAVFEPFIQFGMGFAHQKNTMYRKDGSTYSSYYDVPFVWQLGAGCSSAWNASMGWEIYLGYRNDRSFRLSDQWVQQTSASSGAFTPSTGSLMIQAGRYRSVDLKLTLKAFLG